MEDGNTEVLAETPAPEQVGTVTPEHVEVAPDKVAEQVDAQKSFTQEELDAAIGKRLAREQRKWEREQQERAIQAQPKPQITDVRPEQYGTAEEYAEALAEVKAVKLLEAREAQRQRIEVDAGYHDREEKAREKYADFEQVAYNNTLRITDVMAEAIKSSDVGPDVAYFLGLNPKEADRISKLSPYIQAKEIGRLEEKLAANPPAAKKTSNAPTPISPINTRGGITQAYDTTDPRSIKTMSTSDWINAERARERKRFESRVH